MSLQTVLAQAAALTLEERRELIKALVDGYDDYRWRATTQNQYRGVSRDCGASCRR